MGAARVLLLNRVLTVRPSNPASHRGKGWEPVTECAIRALVARSRPLVAILWGRDASTLKPILAEGNCVAIESPHRPRCPPRADSSARARSAAPTSCSPAWELNRSTGGCPKRYPPWLSWPVKSAKCASSAVLVGAPTSSGELTARHRMCEPDDAAHRRWPRPGVQPTAVPPTNWPKPLE